MKRIYQSTQLNASSRLEFYRRSTIQTVPQNKILVCQSIFPVNLIVKKKNNFFYIFIYKNETEKNEFRFWSMCRECAFDVHCLKTNSNIPILVNYYWGMSLSIHGIYLFSFGFLRFFFNQSFRLLLLLAATRVRCAMWNMWRKKKKKKGEKQKTDEKNLNFYYVRFCIGF